MICPHYKAASQPLCTKLDLVCRKCAGDKTRCLTIFEAEEARAFVESQMALIRGMKRAFDIVTGESND